MVCSSTDYGGSVSWMNSSFHHTRPRIGSSVPLSGLASRDFSLGVDAIHPARIQRKVHRVISDAAAGWGAEFPRHFVSSIASSYVDRCSADFILPTLLSISRASALSSVGMN